MRFLWPRGIHFRSFYRARNGDNNLRNTQFGPETGRTMPHCPMKCTGCEAATEENHSRDAA